MNTLKTLWILVLATVFIMTICWSIVTMTLKTEKLVMVSTDMIASAKTITDEAGAFYRQMGGWVSAFFPQELCTDIANHTRDYYQQYGRDDLKYLFDTIKGEAAKRKLAPAQSSQY